MKPLSSLVSAIGETVGRLTLPSREKKQLETELIETIIRHVGEMADKQTSIIRDEASGNWLQRSWRPLVMLTCAAIVIASTFTSSPILDDTSRFWNLLEIGIGGYIVGRGGERIAGTILKAITKTKI